MINAPRLCYGVIHEEVQNIFTLPSQLKAGTRGSPIPSITGHWNLCLHSPKPSSSCPSPFGQLYVHIVLQPLGTPGPFSVEQQLEALTHSHCSRANTHLPEGPHSLCSLSVHWRKASLHPHSLFHYLMNNKNRKWMHVEHVFPHWN